VPLPVPGRVAEALRRSTVQIRCCVRGGEGSGSGVILGAERVVTNAHVIRDRSLSIETWEGKTLSASVVKSDAQRDLALLAVRDLHEPAATLGDSDRVNAGQPVVAVGNPLGFVGALSSGVVHSAQVSGATGLGGSRWICADIQLAPGNSGGPLADFAGQIIGINTMVVSGGLALAVPSRDVNAFLTAAVSRSLLGAIVQPVPVGRSNGLGMIILELLPQGAAARASLLPGDILVGANSVRFRAPDDLRRAIETNREPSLNLQFLRANRPPVRQVAVQLLATPHTSAA
jgi:serine protease Do